jgi:uncharacterized membrane protein
MVVALPNLRAVRHLFLWKNPSIIWCFAKLYGIYVSIIFTTNCNQNQEKKGEFEIHLKFGLNSLTIGLTCKKKYAISISRQTCGQTNLNAWQSDHRSDV